jgi:hypothetical protein
MTPAARARCPALPLVAAAVLSAPAAAQGPRGAGPDARTPAAGEFRIGLATGWTRHAESYEDGALRGLGDRFTVDSLGPGILRMLATTDAAARAASGLPTFRATAGALATQARATYESAPLLIEAGLTSRLALGVTVPFVTSVMRVGTVVNPTGREANVGVNPALAAPSLATANGALVAQLEAAAAFVNGRIASCSAAPGGSGCDAINANTASARAVVDEARAFADALAALFGGRGGSLGAPFVPLANSVAQAAIASRLAGFKGQLSAFGAPAVSAAAPAGAPAPLTTSAFQALLADSASGIVAHPLESVVRRGVGDMELSATFTWHDSYGQRPRDGPARSRAWWRSAVTATWRQGSGPEADPDDLIPVRIGDHQADLEARAVADAGLGDRWSVTTLVRYTIQQAGPVTLRLPAVPGEPFPEAFRAIEVRRNPGDELAVEVHPRWTPSAAVSAAAFYGYRTRGADAYTGSATVTDLAGAPVTLDATGFGAGTEQREHRFGASVAYSTVAAWGRGKARWPLEIAFTHFQTTRGSGGNVPKLSHDAVSLRWYWQPFGRRTAAAPAASEAATRP